MDNMINDRQIDRFYGECERASLWKEKKDRFYRRRRTMGIKKDCFAYRLGRCSVLTEMVCRRENCSFYKTKEQMEQDRRQYGFVKDYKPKGRKS
ncbi:MAG: hypothetical protein E7403_01780 [Ruminococcaceae bacterium]|nr:hypothetical protein [Oscillospiraceae bacterium]